MKSMRRILGPVQGKEISKMRNNNEIHQFFKEYRSQNSLKFEDCDGLYTSLEWKKKDYQEQHLIPVRGQGRLYNRWRTKSSGNQ